MFGLLKREMLMMKKNYILIFGMMCSMILVFYFRDITMTEYVYNNLLSLNIVIMPVVLLLSLYKETLEHSLFTYHKRTIPVKIHIKVWLSVSISVMYATLLLILTILLDISVTDFTIMIKVMLYAILFTVLVLFGWSIYQVLKDKFSSFVSSIVILLSVCILFIFRETFLTFVQYVRELWVVILQVHRDSEGVIIQTDTISISYIIGLIILIGLFYIFSIQILKK